jgi:hypothetical protein
MIPIDLPGRPFGAAQWASLRKTCGAWWRNELERPLIAMTVNGCGPGRLAPELTPRGVDAAYDFSVPAEKVVDVWDWWLAHQRYLGDAFPTIRPNFGPGHNAVFSGSTPEIGPGTVWFLPAREPRIDALTIRLEEEHPWFLRLCDLYRAAAARWQGGVCLGMSDIVPNLDVVASLRGANQLLLDLCDTPEEVERIVWEVHAAYWKAFDRLDAILRPTNPGWTAWDQILSDQPYLMQQCDFCYMIGPGMFERFVLPELQASCRRMSNSFYHLDGIGQLPHLDHLLSIKELGGIQWIPGTGQPGYEHWIDLYRRIRSAGKKIQLYGPGREAVDRIADAMGSLRGFVIMESCGANDDLDQVRHWLASYKVPA